MGIIDKFKDLVGIPPEEDSEEEMDNDTGYANNEDDLAEDSFFSDTTTKRNKVVKVHATTQLQVVIVKPEKFEDASAIADHLNDKHTVVLNLEVCSKDISRRLIDFSVVLHMQTVVRLKKLPTVHLLLHPIMWTLWGI